jgi:hypothetical protein
VCEPIVKDVAAIRRNYLRDFGETGKVGRVEETVAVAPVGCARIGWSRRL